MLRLTTAVWILAVTLSTPAAPQEPPALAGASLRPVALESLPGFEDDDALAAFGAFSLTCEALAASRPELRQGLATPDGLRLVCAKALAAKPAGQAEARQFFAEHFAAFEILPDQPIRAGGPAFFTGYYEPVVDGALERSGTFSEPLLGRPADLVTLGPQDDRGDLPADLAGARRLPDGRLIPFPDRAAIDSGVLGDTAPPVAFVRDGIEAFLIQVQGSAAVRLADGRLVRLTYAGRNGLPYTSIGRHLIENGDIPESEMTLARLKDWVRAAGQKPSEAGRALMHRNRSFVFFTRDESAGRASGPIGAASVPLTPLRSIAVDRSLWPYGLPYWIEASIATKANGVGLFRKLLIGQDTGSAILGPARADIFFGSGDEAGRLAGDVRHTGRMVVLWPRAVVP